MIKVKTSNQHVHQVAELVRRLNQDEIQDLLRLVPQLQAQAEVTLSKRDQRIKAVREELAVYKTQVRPASPRDAFLGNTTIEGYFLLSDAEREQIWDELYAIAIESDKERDVKPDAILPSR